jgi:HK97 family phage major capsid protein
LQKALARLKELADKLDALTKKETLTADELKAINDTTVEFEACEAEIKTLKAAEAARARAAAPANALAGGGEGGEGGERTVHAVPAREMKPVQKLSFIAAATMKSKHTQVPVFKVLEDAGYGQFVKDLVAEMRQKQVDTTVAAPLIPTSLSSEIIEMLRPETTFFQGNPKKVQFVNGKFKQPRGASGATAGYVGEAAKKPVTGPTFDDIDMSPKKLAGIVLITKEARAWSLPNIAAYIEDDLRAAMSQATDLNAYFGTGAGDSPVGILKQGVPTFSSNDYVANPLAPTITEIDGMASRMVLSLTLANIGQATTWAWLFNYRTLEFLKNLRVGDDTGVYAYPELRLPAPTWKGFRVLVTNQVPINLGATTDETIIALIDFRHVLYGEEEGITVRHSEEATIDVNGTLILLWQQNMEAILTETQHDFGLRHTNSVAVMENIRWGANALTGSP